MKMTKNSLSCLSGDWLPRDGERLVREKNMSLNDGFSGAVVSTPKPWCMHWHAKDQRISRRKGNEWRIMFKKLATTILHGMKAVDDAARDAAKGRGGDSDVPVGLPGSPCVPSSLQSDRPHATGPTLINAKTLHKQAATLPENLQSQSEKDR
jgi:hypothetical protein